MPTRPAKKKKRRSQQPASRKPSTSGRRLGPYLVDTFEIQKLVDLAQKAYKYRQQKRWAGKVEAIEKMAGKAGRSLTYTVALGRAYGILGARALRRALKEYGVSKLLEIIRLPDEDEVREVCQGGEIRRDRDLR